MVHVLIFIDLIMIMIGSDIDLPPLNNNDRNSNFTIFIHEKVQQVRQEDDDLKNNENCNTLNFGKDLFATDLRCRDCPAVIFRAIRRTSHCGGQAPSLRTTSASRAACDTAPPAAAAAPGRLACR